MTDHVQISTDDKVRIVRMNRPEKKNAITAAMYAEMAEGLKNAFDDNNVHAILLAGSPGVFTSGNDIADFMQIAMTGERSSMAVFDFLEQIIMAPKPVVAAVDGLAIGIGTTMLMHCDFVLASNQSIFKTPFVDLGLVPEAGSSLIFPRISGYHRAFELLAMGSGFSATDAKEAGLVNKITKQDELEQAALVTVHEIAAKPPEALKLTRDLLRGDRSDILARMKEEAVLFGQRLESDEAKQAFVSFMNKGKKKAG